MSSDGRKLDDIRETKLAVFSRDSWKCVVCGKPATQIAHVIAQNKMNLRRYGAKVIHHPMNLRSVCSLQCNHAVEISTKAQPREATRIASEIKNELSYQNSERKRSGARFNALRDDQEV
jgi:5-methylcytosine-specific restriction endonuclease McrA